MTNIVNPKVYLLLFNKILLLESFDRNVIIKTSTNASIRKPQHLFCPKHHHSYDWIYNFVKMYFYQIHLCRVLLLLIKTHRKKSHTNFPTYLLMGDGGIGFLTKSKSLNTSGGVLLWTPPAPRNSLNSTPLNKSQQMSSSSVGVLLLWNISSRTSAT